MKTSATNIRLRKLLSSIKDGSLIPRPDFQRRLVWSNKHKVAFLRTVLENLPFPEIYIAAGEVNLQTGEGSEILVDGQQRITTLYQFFKDSDDLKIPKDMTSYSKLSPEDQEAFLEYEVVVRDLGKLPIPVIKDIFQRINSTNYSLNAVEIQNSRYDGELINIAEKLSANTFFEEHRVFTNNDIKRMRDVGFTLSVLISMLGTYFNLESEFDNYLKRFNEEFPKGKEIKDRLNLVFEKINDLQFDAKSRVFKKADLFTLLVEFDRALNIKKLNLDIKKVETKLKEFYREVDGDSTLEVYENYRKDVIQGSNSRSARIRRGETVYRLIASCEK